MIYEIDGNEYDIKIVRKHNKNSYIRVKEDMSILITTGYFTTKRDIKKMLDSNLSSLRKMLNRQYRRLEKNNSFFYLGNSYDIIEIPTIDSIEFDNNYVYIPSKKKFKKWYKEQLLKIFSERLEYNYKFFDEVDICPELKIRTMKTRWGVYNRVKHSVTLNSHLLEHSYDEIDYVIIHELSHVIHFNHSKDFWNLVEKYCPSYKLIRKKLKE